MAIIFEKPHNSKDENGYLLTSDRTMVAWVESRHPEFARLIKQIIDGYNRTERRQSSSPSEIDEKLERLDRIGSNGRVVGDMFHCDDCAFEFPAKYVCTDGIFRCPLCGENLLGQKVAASANHQQAVMNFHLAMNLVTRDRPEIPPAEEQMLRVRLMLEELGELTKAMSLGDLVGTADGIADLLYVVYGTAVQCGINIEPIFAEVHRSNMSKIGGGKDANGKAMKPAWYLPPQLEPILQAQKDAKSAI